MRLDITTNPTQEDMQTVRDGLAAYNVARVPALLDLPDADMAVVLRDASGAIIAGAIAEFDWGLLFVDTLWVTNRLRGSGYATRIMQALEGYAARRGVTAAYLFTTSFQAKPFYAKIGYRVFGENRNRPVGHTTYYMWKEGLTSADTDLDIQVPPEPADYRFLGRALLADIARHRPLIKEDYAIFARDSAGTVKGGLWGGFFWDWFDLRFLWLDEALRGQGWGKRALGALFDECRRRAVQGIVSDTASFQSLPFYQSQGFEVFGTLPGRPPGHESYFIQKRFGRESGG